MNLNQLKTKLLASSYIVMGLVGTIAAIIIIPTYILTNVANRSNIETSSIVIDSISYIITNDEYRFSQYNIWNSEKSRYWIKGKDEINIHIKSQIKLGDTVVLKYGKNNVITSIVKDDIIIFEEQHQIWFIIQILLMGAVFGFIAYWGAKTMKK
jgi:hypothetical protein